MKERRGTSMAERNSHCAVVKVLIVRWAFTMKLLPHDFQAVFELVWVYNEKLFYLFGWTVMYSLMYSFEYASHTKHRP